MAGVGSAGSVSRCIVIGLGGVTNGGKSTLAKRICDTFPRTRVIRADDFYWPLSSDKHIRLPEFGGDSFANFDILTSIDNDSLTLAVRDAILAAEHQTSDYQLNQLLEQRRSNHKSSSPQHLRHLTFPDGVGSTFVQKHHEKNATESTGNPRDGGDCVTIVGLPSSVTFGDNSLGMCANKSNQGNKECDLYLLNNRDNIVVKKSSGDANSVEENKTTTALHCHSESSARRHGDISIIIVEGILIFNHLPLCKLFDLRYFFTLPKEECARRRNARAYELPELEGYLDAIAWPMYMKYKQELETARVLLNYVNGMDPVDDIFYNVHKDIIALINQMY